MRKQSLILHISATRLPHGMLSARHVACDHCRLPNKTFMPLVRHFTYTLYYAFEEDPGRDGAVTLINSILSNSHI